LAGPIAFIRATFDSQAATLPKNYSQQSPFMVIRPRAYGADWSIAMSTLSWLFPSRRPAPSPVDGASVLDRLEVRLGAPLKGDARIILAGQIEVAVQRIRASQSLSSAALVAQREGSRIAAMLPRPFGMTIGSILADELVRGHGHAHVQRH